VPVEGNDAGCVIEYERVGDDETDTLRLDEVLTLTVWLNEDDGVVDRDCVPVEGTDAGCVTE